MRQHSVFGRGVALLVALLVVLAVVPGSAAAESRAGGTVVVAEGETVAGLEAFGGSVVVRGTVDGNLQAFAGDVTVTESGRVTGNVGAAAGSVRIAGTVVGDVEAAAGSIEVTPSGEVGGDLQAAGGSVVLAGTVRGDATLAGESVVLAGSAVVDGGVEYDAESFRNDGAAVGGSVVRNDNLGGVSIGSPADALLPGWVASVYGVLVNLVLGAALLLVFPAVSRRIADRAVESPLAAGGVGLLMVLVAPIALVLVALTIIGIPLSLLGLFLFLFTLWVGLVYGGYTVGEWLTDAADVDNRWLALAVGVVLVALAGRLPIVGGLVTAIVTLLGLGALALVVRDARRDDEDTAPPTATEAEEGPTAA
ncbi:bactofilin family protein [Haloglomus litoreum]|uniref:bactofilin family protein n=1 Tax=Haloglomus litoreum TaxID=3034026 RepID=UPI0023E75E19|nr:polymer-forming cytoskeletal protein [Haloglomus sp. DT116]